MTSSAKYFIFLIPCVINHQIYAENHATSKSIAYFWVKDTKLVPIACLVIHTSSPLKFKIFLYEVWNIYRFKAT